MWEVAELTSPVGEIVYGLLVSELALGGIAFEENMRVGCVMYAPAYAALGSDPDEYERFRYPLFLDLGGSRALDGFA